MGVIEGILEAQEKGSGQGYSKPLAEMKRGAKTGHWIWWIWPSLKGVRQTSRPELELPDLQTAVDYLAHPKLCARLLEITDVAHAHLFRGVKPDTLFGSSTDSLKFQQCMAVMSIAAIDSGAAPEVSSCFVRALRALPAPYAGLEPTALDVLRRAPSESFELSVSEVEKQLNASEAIASCGQKGALGWL